MYDNLDEEASKLLDKISENVVKYRKEKGYSQLKLATEIGYSSASYLGLDTFYYAISKLLLINFLLYMTRLLGKVI